MFVISLKMSRLKVVAVLVLIAIIGVVAAWPRGSVQAGATVNRRAAGVTTNEKRIAFLESYGWKVDPTPIEVVEITIPQSFNKVYENYNAIQKKQGFDLTAFKGRRCKRWTYRVLNYPGVTNEVRANLYICQDQVIGGDVSTVALNGFMHGFAAPSDADSLSAVQPSTANIVSGPVDLTVSAAS